MYAVYEAFSPGPAHAFFGLGGGVNIAVLLPVLKAQLAQQIQNLALQIQQLCHAKAVEASQQGVLISNARILEELVDDGTVARMADVVMSSPVVAQVMSNVTGRTYSGSITQAGWSTARSVDEQTVAMANQSARLWGDGELVERAAVARKSGDGRIYAFDEGVARSGTCTVAGHTTVLECEAASGNWIEGDSAQSAWMKCRSIPTTSCRWRPGGTRRWPERASMTIHRPWGHKRKGFPGRCGP